MRPFTRTLGAILLCAGCAESGSTGPIAQEPSDLLPVEDDGKADGLPRAFDPNVIVDDSAFSDTVSVDADSVQRFFEYTPYRRRSWLADERIGDRRVSQVLVEKAEAARINPLLLVSRLQVEKGLVSRQARPSQNTIDYAMGCEGPEAGLPRDTHKGLEAQMDCAARRLARWHEGSVDGTAQWRKGHTAQTADGVWVTPKNDSTAALYSYTPYVLEQQGGNWLMWNISRRYSSALRDTPAADAASWVGTPCTGDDASCDFSDGSTNGYCLSWNIEGVVQDLGGAKGFCSLGCAGYCPDRAGTAVTFCVDLRGSGVGECVSRAAPENGFCSAIPGTLSRTMSRFVGASGVRAATTQVCVP